MEFTLLPVCQVLNSEVTNYTCVLSYIVLEQPKGVYKQRQRNNLPRGPMLYLFLSSLFFSLIQSSNRREVIYILLMPQKNFDFKQFPMSCARVNS